VFHFLFLLNLNISKRNILEKLKLLNLFIFDFVFSAEIYLFLLLKNINALQNLQNRSIFQDFFRKNVIYLY